MDSEENLRQALQQSMDLNGDVRKGKKVGDLKFETKDWIALTGACITVGSVLWKGGQITAQLEATAEAVRQLSPVVTRLDATTARLEVRSEANKSRIDDLTKRVEIIEERQHQGGKR
jgi:hypothetical protein